jgi:type IV pilus assembly protein PilA
LAQDVANESSAIQSIHALVAAEASYSGAHSAKGFSASITVLGPASGTPDENHAGLIAADLATGTKDGYQFAVSIPDGTAIGGTNFNYFIVAKPASGHSGRTFCADSSGTVRYASPGAECSVTSPTL